VVRVEGERRGWGRFVAFEGGDGAGKSTQVMLLADALAAAGRPVVVTREPGGTPLGQQIRDLLLHGDHIAARAEALLYAADRAHHVEVVVRPALERGDDVVTDRYLESSVAYQGAGRGLGVDAVRELNLWGVGGLMPDLTVVLDVPAEEGRRRRGGVHDRMEREADDFHERVRAHFLGLAGAHPDRYAVVDGMLPQEEVHRKVWERLEATQVLR
jgi:dTMP kinase